MMLKLLQLVGFASTPLNETVLVPCVPPKVDPVIVTEVPTGPEFGERLVILGVTWKATKLLPNPPTETDTPAGPADRFGIVTPPRLLALQLVGATPTPPTVTWLVPWEAQKFKPETVTAVPIGPELGLRLVIFGVTTKFTPLPAIPDTVTTTWPVVAPAGTVTMRLVGLQLVGVAAIPLNVTVLVPWDAPKFAPETVTEDPTGPLFGLRLLMFGDVTVKGTALLVTPPTMTVTFPVTAPIGTGTTMVV
jgi:hypothetical protein